MCESRPSLPPTAVVSVLLPLPLGGAYDYRVPTDGTELGAGDFVAVPLGPREVIGVVWGAGAGDVAVAKLRPVIARLDAPPMAAVTRRFVDWVAAYTLSQPGSVLRMAMSVPAALEPVRPLRGYRRATPAALAPPLRETAARRRVLAVLDHGMALARPDLIREAGVSAGVIAGLVSAGAVEAVALPPPGAFAVPDPAAPTAAGGDGLVLSGEQASAAGALVETVARREFSVTLLDGVTGSGKTEVYFEAVAASLRAGKQVLVMLPEIALTPQWLERFVRRFGAPPAVWHSDLGQALRRQTWRAVALGEVRIVVGARSALFLPFADLGLVIVDEEHESAFKQEDGVAYQGRNMAVVRAQLGEFPAILVSATPSLETVANVARGRYQSLALPNRHGGAKLPEVSAVDMRAHPPPRGRFLSQILVDGVSATVERGEQVLLFLNRRGYAPLTLCRRCGFRLQCGNCTAWLVEHRFRHQLQCHHCGRTTQMPTQCPECEAEDSLVACGPGVERIAEEVAALLPQVRPMIVTSDTTRGPKAVAGLIKSVLDHEVDVLIGTQMLAKGHHFPELTLVGVVDGDLGLSGGDLRAAERTYQVLHQVSGRAGRGSLPGRVLLQSYMPEHPVMQALVNGTRDEFIALELAAREAGGWPPYGRLAALVISGPDGRQVDEIAGALGRTAPRGNGVQVLGPAPAPLALLRGRHRRRLLLRAAEGVAIQAVLRHWLAMVKVPNAVRVQVDVDPYSFL
ncbi:MAG: primosomal protein N' [Alphaproteobacteria bacterium]